MHIYDLIKKKQTIIYTAALVTVKRIFKTKEDLYETIIALVFKLSRCFIW